MSATAQYPCPHTLCYTGQYWDRAIYKNKQAAKRHIKQGEFHCCPDKQACEFCRRYKITNTAEPPSEEWKCTHDLCKRSYKNQSDLSAHELHEKHLRCDPKQCLRCMAIEKREVAPSAPLFPEKKSIIDAAKRKLDEMVGGGSDRWSPAKKIKYLQSTDAERVIVLTSKTIDGVQQVQDVVCLTGDEWRDNVLTQQKEIRLRKLLALKDRFRIPDSEWDIFIETMNVGPKCSIHYIRQQRTAVNSELPVTQTKSKVGAELRIKSLLTYLFKTKNVKPGEKVIVKFAFDGARVTNKTKQSQTIGTVQLITGSDNLHEVKSATNCHQFVIFFGDESNAELKRELDTNLPYLQQLICSDKIELEGDVYNIECVLVCDMACVTEFLGLYSTYCPKSTFRCAWCKVTNAQLGNFDIEYWSFRDQEELVRLGKLADQKNTTSARQKFATTNFGVLVSTIINNNSTKPLPKSSPVLDVPLEKCVPCLLHAVMNLTRLLWNRLISEAISNDAFGQSIINIVETKLKLKVPAEKKIRSEADSKKNGQEENNEKKEVSKSYKRLQRARFVYSEWTKLLKNHDLFATKELKAKSITAEELKELWGGMYDLLHAAMNPSDSFLDQADVEKSWIAKSRAYAKKFTAVYAKEDTMPYLHLLVYHAGFYIAKYGSLEMLANFATEGKHQQNKRTVNSASSGFRNFSTSDKNLPVQELERDARLLLLRNELPQKRKRNSQQTLTNNG